MIKSDNKLWIISAVFLLLWGIVFSDALIGMEDIWRRSDTFAHGYFIIPIVIWLFWRDKSYLLNSNAKTSWFALPFILGSLIVYLIAYAADINVLGQLASVITLISIIWLLLGNRLAWHYKFPLAYLLFLVPMGENLIPDLQDITAWFTVAFLKIHGIPVFRDGLYIQVPSGLFEVAVACSGIRYLIASVAVGTLFAYLSYRSVKKQFIFIVFAFLLPIIANGIRAYLIVIIAHYSDMKYATGADHLIYGWVFFGLIIMMMFWIGGKFADPETSEEESKKIAISKTNKHHFSMKCAAILAAILSITYLIKVNIPLVETPEISEPAIVSLQPVTHSAWGINFNYALMQSHSQFPSGTEVYRAVYANKQTLGELINSQNNVYDPKYWTKIESKQITINDHAANYLLLRNMSGKERVVVYWYRVADKVLLNDKLIKLQQAFNLFINPDSVSELVALSVSDNNTTKSLTQIEQDAKDVIQYFSEFNASNL